MSAHKWRRGSKDASTTALCTLWLLASSFWTFQGQAVASAVAFGLVAVVRILLLMSELLLFGKCLPLAFHLRWLILPLLTDDLGDLGIGKTRMLSDYVGLLVLSI